MCGAPAGMTPLMLAACVQPRGKLDIFFMLLNHPSINLNLKNNNYHTVYDIAFMEEIEYVVKPMTEALEARGMTSLSASITIANKFRTIDGVEWPKKEEDKKTGDAKQL